jgi:hypothetical protein
VNTRVLKAKHGLDILVRSLRNGDVDTVLAVFHRLGETSRRTRFNGSKARLSEAELWQLALVDSAAVALLRRALHALDISLEGPELWIRAAVPRLSQGLASSPLRPPLWDRSFE